MKDNIGFKPAISRYRLVKNITCQKTGCALVFYIAISAKSD